MKSDRTLSRRNFVASTSMAGAGALLMAFPRAGDGEESQRQTPATRSGQSQTTQRQGMDTMLMQTTQSGRISDPKQTAQTLNDLARMVSAHVARGHSEIFPAFRIIMPASQYMELGEQFHRREQAALGGQGLAEILTQVASIEANFGMKDLAQFTARTRTASTVATEQ